MSLATQVYEEFTKRGTGIKDPKVKDAIKMISNIDYRLLPEDDIFIEALKYLAENIDVLLESEELFRTSVFRIAFEALMTSTTYYSMLEDSIRRLKIPGYAAIVDVNSGTGVAVEVAARYHSNMIIASDPFDENLESVEERATRQNINVKLLKADLESLGRKVGEPLGAMLLVTPYTWFIPIERRISKAYTLLESKGVFLMITPYTTETGTNPLQPFLYALKGAPLSSISNISLRLREEGFTKIKIEEKGLLAVVRGYKP